MSNNIKRPFSVWLTQAILLMFGFLFSVGLVIALITLFKAAFSSSNQTQSVNWLVLLAVILTLFAILFFMGFTFWSLVKRKPYGQKLGVASLILIFVMSLAGTKFQPKASLPNDASSESIAGLIATSAIYFLFFMLIIILARSKNVVAFFRQEQTAGQPLTTPENPSE